MTTVFADARLAVSTVAFRRLFTASHIPFLRDAFQSVYVVNRQTALGIKISRCVDHLLDPIERSMELQCSAGPEMRFPRMFMR